MSERRACQLANQPRGTQRYQPTQRDDEEALTRAAIELASQYGRYGYRRIAALLQRVGWRVGKDRIERISTPRTKTCGVPTLWVGGPPASGAAKG
jgi:putative transposase